MTHGQEETLKAYGDEIIPQFQRRRVTLGSITHPGYDGRRHGAVAEWLGRGLQSLVHQFESGRRLYSAWP